MLIIDNSHYYILTLNGKHLQGDFRESHQIRQSQNLEIFECQNGAFIGRPQPRRKGGSIFSKKLEVLFAGCGVERLGHLLDQLALLDGEVELWEEKRTCQRQSFIHSFVHSLTGPSCHLGQEGVSGLSCFGCFLFLPADRLFMSNRYYTIKMMAVTGNSTVIYIWESKSRH